MDNAKTAHERDVYGVNAQHGQNRSGVELDPRESFEEHEASAPIVPTRADDRERDEGAVIRERVHATGGDVVAEEETPGDESLASVTSEGRLESR